MSIKWVRRIFSSVLLTIILGGLILVAGCGTGPGETPTPTTSVSENEVQIANFAFSPATVTVDVGTEITWRNGDSVSHTVTSRDNVFDSGSLSQGQTFSYTFTEKGNYEYFCAIHPYMTGRVVVE